LAPISSFGDDILNDVDVDSLSSPFTLLYAATLPSLSSSPSSFSFQDTDIVPQFFGFDAASIGSFSLALKSDILSEAEGDTFSVCSTVFIKNLVGSKGAVSSSARRLCLLEPVLLDTSPYIKSTPRERSDIPLLLF